MKFLRAVLVTVLACVLAVTTAYGVGYAVRDSDRSPSGPGGSGAPVAQPTLPSQPIEQGPVLEPGDRDVDVRGLQARLFQLGWLPELTTGTYDAATEAAVRGFQGAQGIARTGTVDLRTWERLLDLTDEPTRDAMFNVLHPGPVLLDAGDSGDAVRDLQVRLVQIEWLFGDVTGTYDPATVEAVRGFQAKREIPVTGDVDRRTLDRLHAMTTTPTYDEKHNIAPEPGALDPRCLAGRVLCVDKSTHTMRWVVDGEVQEDYEVRFGSAELPTREGEFEVYLKSRDHVSSLYGASMPFAMFFSGGQAVHYSPDFAAVGYDGASHGCVNVRDYDGMAALFDEVQVGDRVVVYWS
jgi:peptidoglycan hydrolase-like protein with peptidoglycan-binding domain